MIDGSAPAASIQDNLISTCYEQPKYSGKIFLKQNVIREESQELIERFSIKTQSEKEKVSALSGGNIQKVVVAREWNNKPKLMIAEQPTRGIDIGAKAEIQQVVLDLASQGMGVVFISSELEEVVRLSDDIEVLKDRHKIAEIENDDTVSQATIVETIANTNVNTGKEA